MNLKEALDILDFDVEYFRQKLQLAYDRGGSGGLDKAIESFKVEAKRRYRDRSKVLHPDVQGDHEKMVELNNAYDALVAMRIEAVQSQPVVWMHQYVYWGGGGATNAEGTSTFTGMYSANNEG